MAIPVLDKTPPTVAAFLDATFRTLGGVPTYCLTDNEKTVTVEHVARIAVRNPELVPTARYHGTVVRSCMPARRTAGTLGDAAFVKADIALHHAVAAAAHCPVLTNCSETSCRSSNNGCWIWSSCSTCALKNRTTARRATPRW